MSSYRIFTIALVFGGLLLTPHFPAEAGTLLGDDPTAGADEPPVAVRLAQVLDDATARSAVTGVYVRDVETGAVLYDQRSGTSLVPASNMKLVTTAAALELLGPGYRYETRLAFEGEQRGDSVLIGDLLIRGAGDPTFGSRRDSGVDPLRRWAEQLAEEGVQRFEGRIVGDDDIFADEPYGEGWDVSMLETGPTAVPVSGLSYHDNLATVQVRGTRSGDVPAVRTRPNRYLEIDNRARSGSSGSALRIQRELGSRRVRISGSIPTEQNTGRYVPVDNPTRYTAFSLAEALRRAGIETDAQILDVDDLPERPSYRGTRVLARHTSPPLSEIVGIVNRRSNNFFAEQLFRTLSPDGTSRAASRRIESFLRRSGVEMDGIEIVDGSGLSRKSLITPRALGQLLETMAEADEFPARRAFLGSIPNGGERRSTLQNRFTGLSVRAKTGSLQNVRALSGYVQTPTGETLAFSFLVNHFTGPAYRVERLQNRLVRALTTGRP